MNPDSIKQPPNKALNRLTDILFYSVMFIFIVALAFPHNPVGNWYQQFMPNIGDKQINDIIFLDSLNGIAIASRNVNPDTSTILKTTNGGDSWQIISTQSSRRFSRVKFVNSLTGFISGGSGSGTPYLYKTVDGGNTWNTVPGATLGNSFWGDMAVISEDTIWLTDANSLNGGVYRTTNGGASWQQQLNLGSNNPNHIYMYNGRIGFISNNSGTYLRKTTNSGQNWDIVFNKGFSDMFFVDSLKGWSAYDSVRTTSNGGLNWITQILPSGLGISTLFSTRFSHLNTDTIWLGGGRMIFPNNQARGMIFRTINQGNTWLFQIPDTSIIAGIYSNTQFINKNHGWANTGFVQIHTTTGGDPIWVTPVTQISSEVPKEYKLEQNYPNPFNPKTNIKYAVKGETSNVKLAVFDITGKEITNLVNREQSAGIYEVEFDGSAYSSGIYFYSLIIEGKLVDTKRMVLLK